MSRAVIYWCPISDDAPIPPRVRLRVFIRFDGLCQCGCGRKIQAGEQWDCDHIVALINGGSHSEGNLQPLLNEHHKAKTRQDVAIKSKTARVRAKHLGIKRKRSSFQTNRDAPFKKRFDGTVVRRACD